MTVQAPAASAPAGPTHRTSATLWLEVIEDDMPSFPIPVASSRTVKAEANLPAFEIPVSRAVLSGPCGR
jgi:hypothetical protein